MEVGHNQSSTTMFIVELWGVIHQSLYKEVAKHNFPCKVRGRQSLPYVSGHNHRTFEEQSGHHQRENQDTSGENSMSQSYKMYIMIIE